MFSRFTSPCKNNNLAAFTLVELAIVIIIIGLLVGGVIQGQALIRQSEIQNFIKERSAINTAIVTYQGKYNNYPGDDNRASVWFGASTCATEITSIPSSVACDGNINNRMDNAEPVFSHLKLAKLLNASYGTINGYIAPNQINANLKGTVWRIHTPVVTLFEQVGFSWLDITSSTDSGPFTPEEAMTIDQKIDDGNGSSGTVLAINGNNGSCMSAAYSTAAAGSATFQTTITSRTCRIFSRINM